MDGEAFTHQGRCGLWICSIYLVRTAENTFSAVADVGLAGRHRVKLVLSVPRTSHPAGITLLKRKCIEWIVKAEDEDFRFQPSG